MPSFSDILNFLPIPVPNTSTSAAASGLLAEPGSTAYNEQEMALYEAGVPTERNLNNVLPKFLVDAAERVKAERQNVIDPYAAAVAPIDAQIQDLRRQLPQFRTIDGASQRAVIEKQISELQKQKDNLRVQTIPKLQAERAARASGLPTQIVGPNMYATDINVPLAPETKAGESLRQGIDLGTSKAREQNQGLLSQQQPPQEQGFFGNIGEYINEDFLGRVLAIMARPEAFTDPRGLGAGIARAGQAVFAQEKEQAAAKAKTQLEYDKIKADLQKEAIKAGTPTKLTDTMLKVIDRTVAGNKAMSSIGKIRDILAGPGAGGLTGTIENYLADLRALVRANPGETQDNVIRRLQSLLTSQVADTLGFGKDMSPMERELLKNVIPQPDAFTDTNRLKDSLDTLESFIQGKLVSSKLLAQRYDFGDIVDQAANPPSSIIATIK